jgi:hypothetical protein
MSDDQEQVQSDARTGKNDHAWLRDDRHPSTAQIQAVGQRRRDAEEKLEQHLEEAKHKHDDEHGTAGDAAGTR